MTHNAGPHDSRSKKANLLSSTYTPYVSLLCRLILGAVFAYAGVSKILDPGALAASIRSYGLGLPEWFVTISAHGLPYLEVLLGLYLIAGLFSRASAWATNLLMVVFIVALVQGALRGLEIECGCFGSATSSSGGVWGSLWLVFVRDLGLLGLGLWIAWAGAGKFAVDSRINQTHPDQRPSTTTATTEDSA